MFNFVRKRLKGLKQVIFIYSYDSTTGTFTVPPGGDGYYYFSTYLSVEEDEYASFNMEINGELLCTAETSVSTGYYGPAVCSGANYIMEGL